MPPTVLQSFRKAAERAYETFIAQTGEPRDPNFREYFIQGYLAMVKEWF
jgi:hypothetical protein